MKETLPMLPRAARMGMDTADNREADIMGYFEVIQRRSHEGVFFCAAWRAAAASAAKRLPRGMV